MKAVLFDVYETLLTGTRHTDREPRLRQVAHDFGVSFDSSKSLTDRLDSEIRAAHQQSTAAFPEVDIRELWVNIFPSLPDPDAFALAAEEAVHPVIAIPSAEETLIKLAERGIVLGIISNAQAYTRTLLKHHLPNAWELFDPELLLFSYQHRIAKPDPTLFQMALKRLGARGIRAHEILMVGDSEKNDIEPAKALGMQAELVELGKVRLDPESLLGKGVPRA